jgi:hypothetical protein
MAKGSDTKSSKPPRKTTGAGGGDGKPLTVVIDWCYTFYNYKRRHSAADGLSPVNYEIKENRQKPEAA